MVSTDPTDPNFGLETDQSSPNFGLPSEHAEPSTTQKVISGIGEGLGVIQKAQQAVLATPTLLAEALTPEPVKRFMRGGLISPQTLEPVTKVALAPLRGLADIAFGSEAVKEPFDTAGKALSEFASSQTSPENLAVIAGTAGAGALESTLAKRAPSLAETIFGTKPRVAPEVTPQTPEPTISETVPPITETIKPEEITNAVQEQSPSSVLPHPQEGVTETGGERVGVGPSVQGEEIAQARPQTQEVAPTIPQPEKPTLEVPRGATADQAIEIVNKAVEPYQAHSAATDALVTNLRVAKRRYGADKTLDDESVTKINESIADLHRYHGGENRITGEKINLGRTQPVEPSPVPEAEGATTAPPEPKTGAAVPPEQQKFETGKPATVSGFHATDRPIEGDLNPDTWFTDNPKAADFYYSGEEVGGKKYNADVTFKNPLVVTSKEFESTSHGPTHWLEKAHEGGHDGVIITDVVDGDTRSTVFAPIIEKGSTPSNFFESQRIKLKEPPPQTPESGAGLPQVGRPEAPSEPPPVTPETPETPKTGVSSERFVEQYGEDAPIPNTGKGAGELKAIGQSRLDNFQKTGAVQDDPYSVLTNLREGKVPVSKLADDVSLLRAEHQRLKNDAIASEGTPEWEAKSQASLDMAQAIKEVAHGPASDMMRSFQEYDAPRYDNVTDFDQALRERLGRESTSQERVHFKKMADDVTNTRNGKEEAINGAQKRLGKMPKMNFEDAYKSIHDQIAELTKDCVL